MCNTCTCRSQGGSDKWGQAACVPGSVPSRLQHAVCELRSEACPVLDPRGDTTAESTWLSPQDYWSLHSDHVVARFCTGKMTLLVCGDLIIQQFVGGIPPI